MTPFPCLVYIGLPDNPQFQGVQDPQKLAEHILTSKGPSGENKEYLLMLEKALEELSADSEDAHVTDLADRLRKLEGSPASEISRAAVHSELDRIRSGQSIAQQEELEQP